MKIFYMGKSIYYVFLVLALSLAFSLMGYESRALDNDLTPGTEGASCTSNTNCRGKLKCCGSWGKKVCTNMCSTKVDALSPQGVIQSTTDGGSTDSNVTVTNTVGYYKMSDGGMWSCTVKRNGHVTAVCEPLQFTTIEETTDHEVADAITTSITTTTKTMMMKQAQ